MTCMQNKGSKWLKMHVFLDTKKSQSLLFSNWLNSLEKLAATF